MKPRVTLITLGVDDLEKAPRFYRDGVGLPKTPRSPTDFTLAHNVNTRGEVETVMAQANKAGAKIVKPAHDTFYGGYAGYFQDPDGHLWEVAWNPQWQIPE
jgi:uncharacterized protein